MVHCVSLLMDSQGNVRYNLQLQTSLNHTGDFLERKAFVLAAMAASKGALHTPVQVQKLFFVIDRKVGSLVGGPHFNFEPYDYGPFDRDLYRTLDELSCAGLVEVVVDEDIRRRRYRLTPTGQLEGQLALEKLPEQVSVYLTRLSEFIRSLSFGELVSAIYKEFPEMKANSIFQG
jgi:hypothetical protein